MARVIKLLTEEEPGIRVAAVTCTDLIDEICVVTRAAPLATMALGRATIGAILMASQTKIGHKLGLRFRGNGPLQEIYVEATHDGKTRGYVSNPQASLPLIEGKLDVSGGIGVGLLDVITSLQGQQNPQVSTVIIQSGEIGQDIGYYLQQSQQTNNVVALGIHLNEFGRVIAAGGIILELMQSIKDHSINLLETAIKNAPSLSKFLREGNTAEDMARIYLADFTLNRIEHPYSFRFECPCSMERVTRSLILMGIEELEKFRDESNKRSVTCEFCGKVYYFERDDVQKIIDKAMNQKSN